jgi:hypothetical protein
MLNRDQTLKIVVPSTWILSIASLAFAFWVRARPCLLDPYGYILLGLWTLVPPLWFLHEWTLSEKLSEQVKEIIKHYHELARNVWLALIVVLAVIMHAGDMLKEFAK